LTQNAAPNRIGSSASMDGYRRGVTDPLELPVAARAAILEWYSTDGRSLPFRATRDPYAILVSEAMAQQTQAARAGEAWTRFIARFPTVESLATARPADVLRAWQGLGYNRRALALRRAAQAIVAEHGGVVPSDVTALEALPGVGPYTARAVAAIAFGVPVGAVDTNARRVLGRIVLGDAGAVSRPDLQRLADSAVPRDRAADWTHAVMDVGALVCRPARPDCGACPARPWCRYAAAASEPAVRSRPSRDPSRDAPAFPATSRWLRGRIIDRLRAAPDGEWLELEAPVGSHDAAAVTTAALALASEGLIELRSSEAPVLHARLPVA
jgi:A/G-specific adenine glycosylase